VSAVEIRPFVPELGDLKVVPDPRPRLARTRLVVDRAAGTAVWHGERERDAPVELRLGSGRGELAGLVRAVYPPAMPSGLETRLAGRVLLVDGEGAVLVRSGQHTQAVFDRAWPLAVLDASGLPVREERFRNTRLAQQAHRGAAPFWPLTAGLGWFALSLGIALALFWGAVALIVAVLG
jgi:hypothetical protein